MKNEKKNCYLKVIVSFFHHIPIKFPDYPCEKLRYGITIRQIDYYYPINDDRKSTQQKKERKLRKTK